MDIINTLIGFFSIYLTVDLLHLELAKLVIAIMGLVQLALVPSIISSNSLSKSRKVGYCLMYSPAILYFLSQHLIILMLIGLIASIVGLLFHLELGKLSKPSIVFIWISAVLVLFVLVMVQFANPENLKNIRQITVFGKLYSLDSKSGAFEDKNVELALVGTCFEQYRHKDQVYNSKGLPAFYCADSTTKILLAGVSNDQLINLESSENKENSHYKKINDAFEYVAKRTVIGSEGSGVIINYLDSVAPHLKETYTYKVNEAINAELDKIVRVDGLSKANRLESLLDLTKGGVFSKKPEFKADIEKRIYQKIKETDPESVKLVLSGIEKRLDNQ